MSIKGKLLVAAVVSNALSGGTVSAQTFEFMSSVRHINGGDTVGFVSLTHRMNGAHADGIVLRAEVEGVRSDLFDASIRQTIGRLSAGYSWSLEGAGTFALLGGPTHVSRKIDGGNVIDKTGYYAAAEYGGLIGAQTFAGALVQYSSPEKGWYGRVYASYYTSDRLGFGPDLTYLDEPGFSRHTLGVRTSHVIGDTVLSGIVGKAHTRSGDLGRDRSPFIELQLFQRF